MFSVLKSHFSRSLYEGVEMVVACQQSAILVEFKELLTAKSLSVYG